MSIIRPTLHHLNIKTARLREMVAWYATVIGASVQFQSDHAAWMTNDAANHRIAFLSSPLIQNDPDKRNHAGLHHSAFEYASFDDLMRSYGRLTAGGIAPAVCVDHGITISMYYVDPDGNLVELQSDVFGDWERSSLWMSTELPSKLDPVGTFFDSILVYDAYEAGRTCDSIRASVANGEFAPVHPPDLALPF